MKLKEKYLVEIIVAWIILMIGIVSLVLPIIGVTNTRVVFIVMNALVALTCLIGFIKKPKDKDIELLLTSGCNVLTCILLLVLEPSPLNLAITLMIYVTLVSLIRLKKADFYNDRNNKIWKINVITLGLFIIVGVLTSLNFFYQNEVQILVLGYFLTINGILELVDPLTLYLKG